ncbi:MAG: putative Beta-lactamase [Anaerocolumna sp.]|nr:putative Beta-lactamase [Anaerocolumna sp.]
MDYSNLKYLEQVMQKEIDCGSIFGSAIQIIHNNKVVYENELGYAIKEKGVPVKKDTIYRMYSMSKPVTTVAAMILYERGQLNLLSPVSDYLDGFKNQKVYTPNGLVEVNRQVTIKDLLNMTSGVVYPDMSYKVGQMMEELYTSVADQCRVGKPVNTVDFCNMIGRQPLEFHPGEKWRYGASADILGAVIEIITGKKFGQFLREEIFTPLGMVDTDFYVPAEKLNRFAEIYEYIEKNNRLEPCTWSFLGLGNFKEYPAFESGGAGLVSTIEDYSKFAQMLVNGGTYNDVRILGKKTIEYISKPQLNKQQEVDYNWDSQIGYSYGNLMRILVDPSKAGSNGSVGEFGWDGWTGNYFFVDPKENLILIYMIQKCGGGNPSLIRALRSILYGSL